MTPVAAAARALRGAPGLAAAVIATFALGVGLATATFAYLGFYLFPTLPAAHPERVVQVEVGTAEAPEGGVSLSELGALAESNAFELVAASAPLGATLDAGSGAAQHAWGRATTPDYFALFGARAELGRLLDARDEAPGAPPVAVLGHRLWRGAFASDPSAVGRTVELNGHAVTVVGVVARGFQGLAFASEFFLPLARFDRTTGAQHFDRPDEKWLGLAVWARHGPGAGARERAAARATAALAGLDQRSPLPGGARRALRTEGATEAGDWIEHDPYYAAARALAGASALFLLLAAANVSGLLLARATARDREWAVRKALGASPLRLAGAIARALAPAAALGFAGALAVAALAMRAIDRALLTPVGGIGPTWAVEEARALALDARLVAFAAAATLVALAVAIAAPLARVLRRDPNSVLRDESPAAGIGRQRLAPRRLLVVAELALAVVLTVGGSLLVRTLDRLARADPGFDARGLALATVHLPRSAGGAAADQQTLLRLLERAAALPGVRGATLAHLGPNSGWSRDARAAPAGEPQQLADVAYNIVGPRYLSTLGVALLSGRELDERDAPGATPAVVVSRALALRLWHDERAVGRRLTVDLPLRPGESGPEFDVVGVAADAGVTSPPEPDRPWIFFAYGQRWHSRMALVLRSTAPLAALEPALGDAIAAERADASLVDLVSTEEQLRRALHGQRIRAAIAAALGGAGLATALGGLAALQLATVALRRRDLAVRAALGAGRRDLVAWVLGEALALAAEGGALGLAGAAAAVRLIESLLFGVAPLDPATFVAVPLALAAAVVLASLLPALRAARVDPTEGLRAL